MSCRRRVVFFFFSSRRRHTRFDCDWSSDVCSSDLAPPPPVDFDLVLDLPILPTLPASPICPVTEIPSSDTRGSPPPLHLLYSVLRSEERRGGKEGRFRWSPYH